MRIVVGALRLIRGEAPWHHRRFMNGALADWNRGPAGPNLRLAVATFSILALELGVIRWMGGQIRIIAYFQNFVLLAAFFGMGLGVALG